MRACMGGWCLIREICPHYSAEGDPEPADRLCVPEQDGIGKEFPIRITRMASSWGWRGSKRLLAKAEPFDGIGWSA